MLIRNKVKEPSRMSARFFGLQMGMSTDSVYSIWENLGLIIKDKFGEWVLTDAGRSIGGKMSKSNYCPVPTFEFEVIEKIMIKDKK